MTADNNNASKTITLTTSGCLFDLDGTLMMSTKCVEAFWREWCAKEDIDAEELLRTSHGRRTIDLLKMWKPEEATEEMSAKYEATIPQKWKYMAEPVKGVHKFLGDLPNSRWAIVTSGCYVMASTWLKDFLEIPKPEVFITAEDIKEGKPNPEGYLKGKFELELRDDFLVFEDAPSGIKAGKDAGALVIGMATTYDADFVKKAGADIVIPNLEHIRVKNYDLDSGKIQLEIRDPVYA